MFYMTEKALSDFQFWGGAKAVAARLTADELDTIDNYLSEISATLTETEINDEFWFNTNLLLEILEIDEETFWNRPINPLRLAFYNNI